MHIRTYSRSTRDTPSDDVPAQTRPHLQVVQRKKGFGFSALLFNVLDAVATRFLRVHDDGVHVFAQNFSDGDLEFLLRGLAEVNQSAVLENGERHVSERSVHVREESVRV